MKLGEEVGYAIWFEDQTNPVWSSFPLCTVFPPQFCNTKHGSMSTVFLCCFIMSLIWNKHNTNLGIKVEHIGFLALSLLMPYLFWQGMTMIKFLTDGVLIREMMEDPLLTKYRYQLISVNIAMTVSRKSKLLPASLSWLLNHVWSNCISGPLYPDYTVADIHKSYWIKTPFLVEENAL